MMISYNDNTIGGMRDWGTVVATVASVAFTLAATLVVSVLVLAVVAVDVVPLSILTPRWLFADRQAGRVHQFQIYFLHVKLTMFVHVQLDRLDQETIVRVFVLINIWTLIVGTLVDFPLIRAFGQERESRPPKVLIPTASQFIDYLGQNNGQAHGNQGIHGRITGLERIQHAHHLNTMKSSTLKHGSFLPSCVLCNSVDVESYCCN